MADDEQKFISLSYIKGTSEKLKRIFAIHKIRCSFYSKATLRKHFYNYIKKATLYTRFLAKIAILLKQEDLSKLEQMSMCKRMMVFGSYW